MTYALLAIILGLGVAVRAVNLSLPPVDYHSWRQTETAALARNYYEEGFRLFYPAVDWRGNTPGYVESELSLYAFTVALGYGLLGFDEAVARTVTIVSSVITALLLFLIGRKLWGSRAGLFTAAFFSFLSPFGLFFGQAIMGDMSVILLVTLSVYAGLRWSESGSVSWLMLAALSTTLGALSKIPALYAGVPLFMILLIREGPGLVRKPRNWLILLLVLTVVSAWYVHAYQLGQQTGLSFGIWGASDKVGRLTLLNDSGFYRALFRNITYRLLTTSGMILWLLGMFLDRRDRREIVIYAWVGSVLLFFLIAARGVLSQDYYTLALLPPAALFIGKALDWIYGRVVDLAAAPTFRCRAGALLLFGLWVILLTRAGAEVVPSAQEMFAPLEPAVGTWLMGQWVQKATTEDSGLIVVGSSPPEGLYFSHRKGLWLDEHALGKAQKDGWPVVVFLNPFYGGYQTLPDLQQQWRALGGGKWFLAFDMQEASPGKPMYFFEDTPQWGEQISLIGYDLRPRSLVQGKFYVVLHWRAEQSRGEKYVGFIHAWSRNGVMCGQDDHQVLNGAFGTDRWQQGQVVLDAFEVDVSACPGEKEFRLKVGLYDPVNSERLPLSSRPSQDQLYVFDLHLSEGTDGS